MPDIIALLYQNYNLRDYHPGLISFDSVVQMIQEELELTLDLNKHELGFILPSLEDGLLSTYSTISNKDSELSLRSAMSSMFNCYRLKEGEPTLTLYLWDPIPSMPVGFPADSGIIDAAHAKRTRDASSFSRPQELSLAQPPSSSSQSANTTLPASSKVQTLPAGPGLPESTPPAEPNPPNSDAPEADGVLFNINELANKYESEQPKQEDYPDDPEAYKEAMIRWREDERERELYVLTLLHFLLLG
jgi:hypothetical protein